MRRPVSELSRNAGKHRARRGGLALFLGLALAVASASLAPAAAQAAHGIVRFEAPAGVEILFIEFASAPKTENGGYFWQDYFEGFSTLGADDDHYDFVLKAGTHYLHVAGQDEASGLAGECPPRLFSDTFRFVVDAGATTITDVTNVGGGTAACGPPRRRSGPTRPPQIQFLGIASVGGGGGGGGGGGVTDTRAPTATLSARHSQRVGNLHVFAKLDEAGYVSAFGSVRIGGGRASAVYRFNSKTRKAAANVRTKLRLKTTKKKLRVIKRALRNGRRLKAKITITARDAAGNLRVRKMTVRLKA